MPELAFQGDVAVQGAGEDAGYGQAQAVAASGHNGEGADLGLAFEDLLLV